MKGPWWIRESLQHHSQTEQTPGFCFLPFLFWQSL